jgi:hypothetical protein
MQPLSVYVAALGTVGRGAGSGSVVGVSCAMTLDASRRTMRKEMETVILSSCVGYISFERLVHGHSDGYICFSFTRPGYGLGGSQWA